jgi:hypothetical protein
MRRHEAGAKFVAQGFGLLVILVAITSAIVVSLISTRGRPARRSR